MKKHFAVAVLIAALCFGLALMQSGEQPRYHPNGSEPVYVGFYNR